MKLICLKENLRSGLLVAERVIGKSLTLPILNNLLLETNKGKLKISSTNLEIGLNYWISGKIEKEGSLAVPARVLTSFVASLPNKKIEIETKEDVLWLKCEGFRAKIKGQSASDYPIIPKIEPQRIIKINQKELKGGLAQVVGMAAVSEIRPEISGVLLRLEKNVLKIAATDSFRLAEKTIFLGDSDSQKENSENSIILPQKTAMELLRILSEATTGADEDSFVKVFLSAGQVMFDFDYAQLVSRLIDGQYPDYQQIIPIASQTRVLVDTEELARSIKAASFFSSKINDVQLSIEAGKNLIEVFSESLDIGENKTQLDAECEGKNLKIAFNWRYLLDGINNINTKKVLLGMNDESKAAVLRPAGDESYLYVIMPIKSA